METLLAMKYSCHEQLCHYGPISSALGKPIITSMHDIIMVVEKNPPGSAGSVSQE